MNADFLLWLMHMILEIVMDDRFEWIGR